jgi:hypothetical protein
VSPLAIREPRPIAKLPFYPIERLTAAEIAQIKATPWNREWVLEPFERIYASYPTLFYLSLFAIAQPITEWLDLTPYQSLFAYRFVTAGLAALLWTVYAMLRRTPATQSMGGWLVSLIVLNPMVAFMSGVRVIRGHPPLAREFPSANGNHAIVVRPVADTLNGGGAMRMAGMLLAAVAGVVLLIACSHVANLRGERRAWIRWSRCVRSRSSSSDPDRSRHGPGPLGIIPVCTPFAICRFFGPRCSWGSLSH